MWPNPQETADLVTFTEEILNRKLLLRSVVFYDILDYIFKESNFDTGQKMKFPIKDFFSKCDQIRSFLRIWSHLLKKSRMENFIFFVQCDFTKLRKDCYNLSERFYISQIQTSWTFTLFCPISYPFSISYQFCSMSMTIHSKCEFNSVKNCIHAERRHGRSRYLLDLTHSTASLMADAE